MEQACVIKHGFRHIFDVYVIDGRMFPVVDDTRFARIGTIFVIVNTDAAVICCVGDQVIFTDAGSVHLVFDECGEQIVRNLRDHCCL